MSESRTIFKNAGVLMAAQVVTWGLTLVLTIFQPRLLGAAGVGELNVAISLWTIAGVLTAFGTETLLIKELARRSARADDLLGAALLARLLIFAACAAVVAAWLLLSGASRDTVTIVALMGLAQLIIQAGGPYVAALQGLELMGYVSVGGVIAKAVLTMLGVAALLLGFGLAGVGWAWVISSLVGALIPFAILRRGTALRPRYRAAEILPTLRAGAPYLLSILALTVYTQLDVLVIQALVDREEVGWYGAAMQLYGSTMFVPTILITALFPALARLDTSDRAATARMLGKSADVMLLLSVPIGLGLLAVAGPLVVMLFGPEFAPSGPILALLGVTMIFTYLNTLFGRFLIAVDRQNVWTAVIVAATLLTLPLDLLLVPVFQQRYGNGGLAGAVTFLITELLMTAVAMAMLPRGVLRPEHLRTAGRITLAGLVMLAVTWPLRELPLVVPVAAGAATYLGLVALMRVVPAEDLAMMRDVGARALARLRPASGD